jgi:hypothetical protein
LNLNREEFDKNLQKRKEEAITELYHTGRYKGLYMGKESRCKDNPIRAYIAGWLKMKGVKDKAIEQEMNDYYNELFKEIHLIKLEKWEELLENPKKLTATICLIAQRHLFRDVNEKYPKAKSYYEKNKLFSTSLDREIQRVNHNEFLDIEGEYVIGDIEINPFENKYGITCDKFLSLMTAEEKDLFYSYINKRGTGQKGRYTNADKEHYANIYNEISGICNRIKSDLNK